MEERVAHERPQTGGRLLSNPRTRALVFQAGALVAVMALILFLGVNTAENLQRQGVASGFAFLGKPAGFGILQHLIPYSERSTIFHAFLVGLLNTLLVSVLGVVMATFLGFAIGIARLSSNVLVAKLALIYVELLRNVPLLLQLFFWYFGVLRTLPAVHESFSLYDALFLNIRGLYLPAPQVDARTGVWGALVGVAAIFSVGASITLRRRQIATGGRFPVAACALAVFLAVSVGAFFALGRPIGWQLPKVGVFNFSGGLCLLPELVALLVALSTYTAAFIAEIVRSGIQAISPGQVEAANALGLTRAQTLRHVVMPQALRVILPPLTSQFLNLTKNSSMAAVIAYPDLVLVFAGTVLLQTGQAVEVIAVTMGVYLAISLSISLVMNILHRRTALMGR